MRTHWLVLVLFAGVLAARAELPPLTIPQGLGVNIHFTRGHERDLDLIQAAGIHFIRMDFSWAGTEHVKGSYDWAAYDELTTNLQKRGMAAIYILDYSNPLYEATVESKNPITGETHKNTASPQHLESVRAFAAWAAEAVKHFSNKPIVWEIWNEPNISFWSPKPDVQQYSTLALATAKAIRQADNSATVIAPATSEMPLQFLEECFKAGLLDHIDAVSVHPYRDYRRGPETAAAEYQKLRTLIDTCAPEGKKGKLPIISGEWGYATHTKGVSLDTQAAFAVRQQLSNLLNRIPISIWYDWKNDGPDAAEREHNFGLVNADLSPKPAYTAVKTFAATLSGCSVKERLSLTGADDYALLLANGSGKQILACWTTKGKRAVELELSSGETTSVPAIRWNGEKFEIPVQSRKLRLDLDAMPQYLMLTGVTLKKPAAE